MLFHCPSNRTPESLMSPAHIAIWIISGLSIALMLIHPRDLPEAWWIGIGAAALVVFRLIPLHLAAHAIAEGSDLGRRTRALVNIIHLFDSAAILYGVVRTALGI